MFHLSNELANALHAVDCRFATFLIEIDLLGDEIEIAAHLADKTEKQMRLKVVEQSVIDAQRVHKHAVRGEFDMIKAAEGRGVLILFAACDAQIFALDNIVEFGELIRREFHALEFS